MKKLIPLFLAAIMLLCNIFAGNALAANETAPETFRGYTKNYIPVEIKCGKNIKGLEVNCTIESVDTANDICIANLNS